MHWRSANAGETGETLLKSLADVFCSWLGCERVARFRIMQKVFFVGFFFSPDWWARNCLSVGSCLLLLVRSPGRCFENCGKRWYSQPDLGYFTTAFIIRPWELICIPGAWQSTEHVFYGLFWPGPNCSVTRDCGRWHLETPVVLHSLLFLKRLCWLQNPTTYLPACKLVG